MASFMRLECEAFVDTLPLSRDLFGVSRMIEPPVVPTAVSLEQDPALKCASSTAGAPNINISPHTTPDPAQVGYQRHQRR